jgi:hypothetical protein
MLAHRRLAAQARPGALSATDKTHEETPAPATLLPACLLPAAVVPDRCLPPAPPRASRPQGSAQPDPLSLCELLFLGPRVQRERQLAFLGASSPPRGRGLPAAGSAAPAAAASPATAASAAAVAASRARDARDAPASSPVPVVLVTPAAAAGAGRKHKPLSPRRNGGAGGAGGPASGPVGSSAAGGGGASGPNAGLNGDVKVKLPATHPMARLYNMHGVEPNPYGQYTWSRGQPYGSLGETAPANGSHADATAAGSTVSGSAPPLTPLGSSFSQSSLPPLRGAPSASAAPQPHGAWDGPAAAPPRSQPHAVNGDAGRVPLGLQSLPVAAGGPVTAHTLTTWTAARSPSPPSYPLHATLPPQHAHSQHAQHVQHAAQHAQHVQHAAQHAQHGFLRHSVDMGHLAALHAARGPEPALLGNGAAAAAAQLPPPGAAWPSVRSPSPVAGTANGTAHALPRSPSGGLGAEAKAGHAAAAARRLPAIASPGATAGAWRAASGAGSALPGLAAERSAAQGTGGRRARGQLKMGRAPLQARAPQPSPAQG